MIKFSILFLTCLVAASLADDVLQQLLHRVPAIHELSKPTLMFLKSQHLNNEAAEIEKHLTKLDHFANDANHDVFGNRVQLLSEERMLIALIKNALIKRSEMLYPKADQAIHANANLATEIKKEKTQLEHLTSILKASINQYDNNIKMEKEMISVQDKLEQLINKVLGHF